MGSIPAIPYAQYVPSLLFHERFNEDEEEACLYNNYDNDPKQFTHTHMRSTVHLAHKQKEFECFGRVGLRVVRGGERVEERVLRPSKDKSSRYQEFVNTYDYMVRACPPSSPLCALERNHGNSL